MSSSAAVGQSKRRAMPAETGVFVVLSVLCLAFAIRFPEARNGATVSVILTNLAEISIIAAGMTLVIATGGIDVSVGSIAGLCGIVLGKLTVEKHMGLLIALPLTLVIGSACGWVNGTLISRYKLPPIIATLAMFSAARAGAYVLSNGNSISGLPDSLTNFGYGSALGVPTVAWLAGAVLVTMGILLKYSKFGRSILSLGGNREASFLSGVPIGKVETRVYVFSGLCAAIAAVVMTARGATAVPDAGKYLELRAITAVVVGGTPVIGGRATMIGTMLGLVTIGVVQQGVVSFGKDVMWEMLVMAVVLLAAVEVDRWRLRRALAA
ncbi:MAG: ABC transporter permease [Chthonomonadales bacterium]